MIDPNVMNALMKFDPTNEIINLWLEVTYLRFAMDIILAKNIDRMNMLTKIEVNACREAAQKVLMEKFPKLGITFKEASNFESEPEEKKEEIKIEENDDKK